jgi:hypothetical protein
LSGQGVIEGKVVNSATKLGIDGVSIAFFTGRGGRYETVSGAQGAFGISNVPAGNYVATLDRSGYAPKEIGLDLGERGKDPPIQVSSTGTATVTLEMQPISEIRGYVIDPDGKPARNIRVQLTGPMIKGSNASVASSEDGSYQFEGVLPGSFTLVADASSPAIMPAIMKDNQRVATVTTYWPSETDPSPAQKILVTGEVPVVSLDIQMQRRPVYRVSGFIRTATGEPARGAVLELLRIHPAAATGSVGFLIPIQTSDSVLRVAALDGAFEFPAVQDGDWTIRANGMPAPEALSLRPTNQLLGFVSVQVHRGDVRDLEIRLQNSFALGAKMELEGEDSARRKPGSAPLPFIFGELVPLEGGRPPAMSLSQPDGTSRFELVFPGQYRFYTTSALMTGAYIAHVFLGGDDVLGQTINLDASSPPMRIVYKQGAGTVRASIEKGAGTVVLLPGIGPTADGPRISSPLEGKVFDFTNLRPGEYYLLAFDRISPARLADPLFVAGLIPLAKRVSIEEKGSVTVELPLNRWPE